jgi:predicted ferric reductase
VTAGLGVAGATATVMLWWRAEGGSPGGGLGGSALALSLGRLAGLLAGSTLILQLLLAARLPVLERWVGPDGLLGWHRRNGAIPVALVGLHATLVIATSQQLSDEGSPWQTLLTLIWLGAYCMAAATFIGFRWVLPVVRAVRYRMRVASIDDETRDVASLFVTGRRLEALPTRPGQSYAWRFLSPTHWWRPHPFSLSAVPSADAMRITIQAAGAGTRRLVDDVRPGTLIAAEDPTGSSRPRRAGATACCWSVPASASRRCGRLPSRSTTAAAA